MIDSEFSPQSFSASLHSQQELSEKIAALESEIEKHIHQAIEEGFESIAVQLNELGHHLTLYEIEELPGIAYRDDFEDTTGYHCRLRIALDTIVAVAYTKTELF
jgi:hypothetical protein